MDGVGEWMGRWVDGVVMHWMVCSSASAEDGVDGQCAGMLEAVRPCNTHPRGGFFWMQCLQLISTPPIHTSIPCHAQAPLHTPDSAPP